MIEVKDIHEIIQEISPYYKKEGKPDAEHTLVYDSSAEALEPVYFFVIDLMNEFGLAPEKLIDNFSSTEGSPYFSETGMKTARMQDEASKMMQVIYTIIRSLINLIHDLKDFKIRLQTYDDLKSRNDKIKYAAKLSLKQIWLDKVDILKGNSSIKAMAMGQAGFQTLLDAFLVAKDEKDADKLDLNDRVKRIVKTRVYEFNNWLEQSDRELRKRYEIEKNYMKSQVNSLKLYTRWVKPYLRAAQKLEAKESGRSPDLVKMFNTVVLELTLLGKLKVNIEEAALAGELPKDFKKMKTKREYYSCVLVDFNFRAVPSQGRFIGKSKITFRGYTLNDDELKKLDYELDKSDLGDAFRLIEGTTTDSLEQMQKDIDFFLSEEESKSKKSEMGNPFSALIGRDNKPEKKEESKKSETKIEDVVVKPDNWIEKNHIRKLGIVKAKDTAYKLFDIYKKAYGMASFT